MPLNELELWCIKNGQKSYRAKQLLSWIHKKQTSDFHSMTNLSKNFINFLKKNAKIFAPDIENTFKSNDGSKKWLLNLGSGNIVETVLIPEKDRNTICISSQAGCIIDCAFCSTGHQGFSRNLTSDEIVGQLWRVRKETSARISNVVMMGMGEPLLNFDNLIKALNLMLDDNAYGLSKRKVTVSTSGIVPMIDRLSEQCPVSLAVSLHAGNDALRDQLVPINKKYPINDLLNSCVRYLEKSPRDFITFEIVMLKGVNDSIQNAKEILRKVVEKKINCKFNLIPFNSFESSKFTSSCYSSILDYSAFLQDAGYVVTSRKTRGDDISAACGQLAGQVVDRTNISKRKNYFFKDVSIKGFS
ncbi:MAG: 23S rRNA (adenine(2503)-C(2))-methyltransferase [Betaproteobacteria bacterium TMED41]|nr:MAG: 23S rRNA (adenine(2503)-C(2))-methyltransferase [Betaproteobacteria bacterium TMED41]|tara:strand:- start:4456 stop:5529 length:1074 start_codon:yes stop_codon:yes gene_type:complete